MRLTYNGDAATPKNIPETCSDAKDDKGDKERHKTPWRRQESAQKTSAKTRRCAEKMQFSAKRQRQRETLARRPEKMPLPQQCCRLHLLSVWSTVVLPFFQPFVVQLHAPTYRPSPPFSIPATRLNHFKPFLWHKTCNHAVHFVIVSYSMSAPQSQMLYRLEDGVGSR